MKTYADLLRISPGFQRSINIKYDMLDPEKVASYIPTDRTTPVIHDLFYSVKHQSDRALYLGGSYGTGKSHLAAFLGAALGKLCSKQAIDPVLDKINDPNTINLIQDHYKSPKRYLVVPIVGGESAGLASVLLRSLHRKLQDEGVKIGLKTPYTAAVRKMDLWKSKFPSAFARLQEITASEYGVSVEQLREDLLGFSARALTFFKDIYPRLTYGAQFLDFDGSTVLEYYEDALRQLPSDTYTGIVLIFDEFNKSIESQLDSFEALKALQDLAELANRTNFHMVLISHRTIGQYSDTMSQHLADEWRKIEGRFKVYDVTADSRQTYKLMKKVISKEPVLWQEFREKYANKIFDPRHMAYYRMLFEGYDLEQIQEDIVEGCFPLHPTTAYVLPRLAARLAQNERTVFTFLAALDDSPIRELLKTPVSMLKLVLPYKVWDYFRYQLASLHDSNSLKQIWNRVNHAVHVVGDRSDEAKILKTLGVLELVEVGSRMQPTRQLLQLCLEGEFNSRSFERTISTLVQKRLILVSDGDEACRVVRPSTYDIPELVSQFIDANPVEDILNKLEHYIKRPYVIPYRYNHEYKLTRFLKPILADFAGLRTILENPDNVLEDGVDGIIVYLIPENESDISDMKRLLERCNEARILFVLPNVPLRVRVQLQRIAALQALLKQEALAKNDPNFKDEVKLYLQDATSAVHRAMEALFAAGKSNSYFWGGKRQPNISTPAQLARLASEMMYLVFSKTPKFNNELLNKHNVSGTSRRARNKVIEVVLSNQFRADKLESSQEKFIYRTLLEQTGFVTKGRINVLGNNSVQEVMQALIGLITDSNGREISFHDVYSLLLREPFGVRRGVIPVIIAVIVHNYRHILSIVDETGTEHRITADLLGRINVNPSHWRLRVGKWLPEYRQLINGLGVIFGLEDERDIFLCNKFSLLAEKMVSWLSGLPKTSRETRRVSEVAVRLRRAIRLSTTTPRSALVEHLPRLILEEELTMETVPKLLQVVEKAKVELESYVSKLRSEVIQMTREVFIAEQDKGQSLSTLIKSFCERTRMNNHHSQRLWNSMQTLNTYDDDIVLNEVVEVLMGIQIEDWNDSSLSEYLEKLEGLVDAQRQVAAGQEAADIVIKLRGRDELYLQETDVSLLGEKLQNHLESALDNFGQAISSQEKRQILINLLRYYLQ